MGFICWVWMTFITKCVRLKLEISKCARETRARDREIVCAIEWVALPWSQNMLNFIHFKIKFYSNISFKFKPKFMCKTIAVVVPERNEILFRLNNIVVFHNFTARRMGSKPWNIMKTHELDGKNQIEQIDLRAYAWSRDK